MLKPEIFDVYLLAHSNEYNRMFHSLAFIAGTFWAAGMLFLGWPLTFLLISIPITYGINWLGHFLFEKNQPLSFERPFQAFLAYWKMTFMTERRYKQELVRILKVRLTTHRVREDTLMSS
jgi:hypothetical protein